MIIFDVQSAVYGVGSGNAPALHVERRTPNDGFYLSQIYMLHSQNRARPCPPSPSYLTESIAPKWAIFKLSRLAPTPVNGCLY